MMMNNCCQVVFSFAEIQINILRMACLEFVLPGWAGANERASVEALAMERHVIVISQSNSLGETRLNRQTDW